MNKKIVLSLLAMGAMSVGFSSEASAMYLAPGLYSEDETSPSYPVNQLTDFLITKINPSNNTISAMYTNRSGLGLEKPFVVNITSGEIDDLYLSYLHSAAPGAMNRVYNNSTYWGGSPQFLDGVEENLTAEQLAMPGGQDVPISEHEKKELVYSVAINLNAGYWVAGRLDYSRCVNAPEYEEGMECRAEIIGDYVQYQPYKDGVRVEITEAGEMENDTEDDSVMEDSSTSDSDATNEEMVLPEVKPILPTVPTEDLMEILAMNDGDVRTTMRIGREITESLPETDRETLAESDNASASLVGLYNSETTNDKKEDDAVNVPELGLARHVPCMMIGAALMSLPIVWWFLILVKKRRKENEKSKDSNS